MASDAATLVEYVEQRDQAKLGDALKHANPQAAAKALNEAQRELYWQRKDIPAVRLLSQTGIKYLFVAANDESDDSAAFRLRCDAKALAYNLASFTWPGWSDGHEPTAEDVAAGFDAAQLNLRLAEELNRPERGKANAHWMMGAHQLVRREFTAAIASFRAGQVHAAKTGSESLELMIRGYELIAEILSNPANATAKSELDEVVARLRSDPTDDAKSLADQLITSLQTSKTILHL